MVKVGERNDQAKSKGGSKTWKRRPKGLERRRPNLGGKPQFHSVGEREPLLVNSVWPLVSNVMVYATSSKNTPNSRTSAQTGIRGTNLFLGKTSFRARRCADASRGQRRRDT